MPMALNGGGSGRAVAVELLRPMSALRSLGSARMVAQGFAAQFNEHESSIGFPI